MKFIIPILLIMLGATGMLCAEMREFTSASGKKMEAELVSHKAGKITLRRADGVKFEVLPNVFGPDDQLFIKEWMGKTAETISYNFRFNADRKKIDGRSRKVDYYRVKNEKWVYEVTITNLSRDEASNLKIKYRQFRSNEADDTYRASSSDQSNWITDTGETKVAGPVGYGKSMIFQTKQMQIDHVDSDYWDYDWRDRILGLMIQIEDPNGTVVAEWAEPVNTLKGKTWASTAPKKGKETGSVTIQ
ncbi:MAG: SHD1 domain-containing protein [Verrucomicrobiota bacterium]